MAVSATVQLRGYISSLPGGSRAIAPTDYTNTAAPVAVTQVTLASGDNTITVPAGSRGVIIIFASGSTTTKKLKGVGGDTGVTLDKTGYNFIRFETSPPANFIINSSVADTSNITEIIFV
jgi:hypothetical protein